MSDELGKIRIFLLDDHGIVKEGIKSLLSLNEKYLVVGEGASADDLLFYLNKSRIDLLITDITLGGMSGVELTKKVKKSTLGALKVLVISMHADTYNINQAFDAGANGFLIKDFDRNELYSAIDKIMRNEVFISRSVSKILADNYLNNEFSSKGSKSARPVLTKREIEIINFISAGYSNKQIADKINLSVSTIDVHRYNILKKLEVKNTAELIMKAIKMKVIKVD